LNCEILFSLEDIEVDIEGSNDATNNERGVTLVSLPCRSNLFPKRSLDFWSGEVETVSKEDEDKLEGEKTFVENEIPELGFGETVKFEDAIPTIVS